MGEKTDLEKYLEENTGTDEAEAVEEAEINEAAEDDGSPDEQDVSEQFEEQEPIADEEAEEAEAEEDELFPENNEEVKRIEVTLRSDNVHDFQNDARHEPVIIEQKKGILPLVNTIIASLTLGAVVIGIISGMNRLDSIRYEAEEKQKRIEALEEENSMLQSDYAEVMNYLEETVEEPDIPPYLAEAGNGKLLIYEDTVGYSWVPILTGIKLNTYKRNNFTVDDRGRMHYTEDGEESSYFGIDVSSYQGDINWQLAREDGVEFAFLRIGYRGYAEEGKICEDEKFDINYSDAHDAGIDLGVYFFSQAATPEEAVEEAEFLIEKLDGRPLEYPIVYDWEMVFPEDGSVTRTEDVMPQTLNLCAIAFCEAIEDAGYKSMIYTNKKQAVLKYDLRQLSSYPIWLAYYKTELNYCYDFSVWQYGTGLVDGIEGEVDLNIAMIP